MLNGWPTQESAQAQWPPSSPEGIFLSVPMRVHALFANRHFILPLRGVREKLSQLPSLPSFWAVECAQHSSPSPTS